MSDHTQTSSEMSSTHRQTPVEAFLSSRNIVEYDTFDDMGLPEDLLRGIYANGFERPSAIQRRAIVPMMSGIDIIGQAQSGTGKTGTFSTAALARIDTAIKAPQVLVLSPTRELSQQTETVAKALSFYMGIKVHCATGGPPISEDIRALDDGAQFIVGTPGRIYDLIQRRKLVLTHIKQLILDEADQMLEDRFKEQVLSILQFNFPDSTKVALFSATMPASVQEVADRFLQHPTKILIPTEQVTLEGIKQYHIRIPREEWKFDVLDDIYKHLPINQLIIFVNKRARAEWLAEKMRLAGHTLEYIHGEMEVAERKERMKDFRAGKARVLISTDLLARGIDVQQVSLVINFELPPQRENYIHRIGRCGRYGRKGAAINIVTDDEMRYLKEIESYYSTDIPAMPEDLSKIGI
jgi:superfamily II DNA/RNA helicase